MARRLGAVAVLLLLVPRNAARASTRGDGRRSANSPTLPVAVALSRQLEGNLARQTQHAHRALQTKVYHNALIVGLSAERGAAIYHLSSGDLDIRNAVFSSNAAVSNGGAVSFKTSGALTINNATFTNNTARYGGAVQIDESVAMHVFYSRFEHNTASSGGGACWCKDVEVLISGCAFTGNTGGANSGALHMDGDGVVAITDTTFVGNQAPSGGAIQYLKSSGALTLTAVLFASNDAPNGAGGALQFVSTLGELALTINNATFRDNTAKQCTFGRVVNIPCTGIGGAHMSITSPSKVVLRDVTFSTGLAKTELLTQKS